MKFILTVLFIVALNGLAYAVTVNVSNPPAQRRVVEQDRVPQEPPKECANQSDCEKAAEAMKCHNYRIVDRHGKWMLVCFIKGT